MIRGWGWITLGALLTGCATPGPGSPPPTLTAISVTNATPAAQLPAPAPVPRHFEGRLSVTVQSEPMQYTSADFELDGDAESGEMKFYGPFGGLALVLQWEPGKAVLIEGDQRRTVPSLEWLMQRLTGASLPTPMMFDWLLGKPVTSNDWWIESRSPTSGRLRALRLQPLPRIEILIALRKAEP